MLDNLRNLGRSWVAKILLGLLIVAVAGFGVPSVFLDLNASTVARVGDQNISVRDFDRLYRSQLNQFAAQTGQVPTAQQAVSFGLPGSALGRLAGDAAMEMLAQRLDLGAAEARVAQLVRQDPAFAGALGSFDRAEFVAVLRQVGYTESEYLNLQRRAVKREQIGAMFDNVPLPAIAREIAVAYEHDRRTVDYIELNPILFATDEEPDEAELAQFFEENQERFVTEETRIVRLLPLTQETLAAGIEISEAEIEAEYERTAAQYTTVERRTVHQVPLDTGETAALFEQGRVDGRDFLDLVAEAGLDGRVVRLGTFARTQMTDPNLGNAAFALEEGEFAVIGGALGQRAVWVSEIEPGGRQPLEAVRGTIEQTLRIAGARDRMFSAYDDIEEARAAFMPFDEAAALHGLEVHDIALTRDGTALAAIGAIPVQARANVVNQIFSASQTMTVTPAINMGSNQTLFFELVEVQPVRNQTLDEVRDEAVRAWRQLQTDMAITRAAEDMVAALDMGADMLSVAAETGRFPQASPTFGRDGTQNGAIAPEVAQAAFVGGVGHADYVRTAQGDVVVFVVTQVLPAPEGVASPLADAVGGTFADVLYSSFVEGLREDAGIRINETALNRLIGLE